MSNHWNVWRNIFLINIRHLLPAMVDSFAWEQNFVENHWWHSSCTVYWQSPFRISRYWITRDPQFKHQLSNSSSWDWYTNKSLKKRTFLVQLTWDHFLHHRVTAVWSKLASLLSDRCKDRCNQSSSISLNMENIINTVNFFIQWKSLSTFRQIQIELLNLRILL